MPYCYRIMHLDTHQASTVQCTARRTGSVLPETWGHFPALWCCTTEWKDKRMGSVVLATWGCSTCLALLCCSSFIVHPYSTWGNTGNGRQWGKFLSLSPPLKSRRACFLWKGKDYYAFCLLVCTWERSSICWGKIRQWWRLLLILLLCDSDVTWLWCHYFLSCAGNSVDPMLPSGG